MNRENLLKYFYSALLGMIILIGVLLRLKGLLINPSMWHDECALGWNIKFKNYSDFFGILRFMQMAPPFFMIATKLTTKIFGFSDIVLRILPFLAGVASIMVFYFLALRTLKLTSSVLWATFFFAINQQLINYSFEFKPYNFDVLFTIICLIFFIDLNLEKLSLKKTVFYGILLALIPWCSFVSMFIIAGGFLNLLLKRNLKTDWQKKIALIFPIIISSLIYLKLYLINNYTGTHMVNYWQNDFVTDNPLFFLDLLIKNIRYFFFPIQYVLFSLILIIWGIKLYAQEKSSFLNISVISFILLIVASFFHLYPFYNRLILFLIPIFLLLMIKPLDLASFDKKFKLFIILFLLFFTLCPQIISTYKYIHTQHISRGENPREMMSFMVKNINKNDLIFVNDLSNTEFIYYSSLYKIKNTIIQGPQKGDHIKILNSIKATNFGRNCWFYLAYGDSTQIIKWIYKNTEVIKKIKFGKTDDYLIYAHLK